MKRIVTAAATVMLAAAVFASAANARPSSTETITTTLPFSTFPTSAPYVASYTGTFSALGVVSDTNQPVTVQARFGAVPSPVAGVLQTLRTLTGSNGTLTLRCTERISPPNQSSAQVTDAGSCAVLNATGSYAGFRGSGTLTGITDFAATPVTLTDVLTL